MSRFHYISLLLLSLAGAFIFYTLYSQRSQPPLGLSFSPVFQLLGKSTKSVDIALTRILPIDEMDEKAYGDAIAEEYKSQANVSDKNYIYLNSLITELSKFSKKKFTYHVFVISTPVPNAYALPGGIICVTEGLMNTMKSEAEIVSVLSHEMGHVERGHCFDAIKYELTLKKIKSAPIGQLADFVINSFLHHTFSKTQENDADEYGYDLLLLTNYDPMEFSGAFKQLQKEQGKEYRSSNIVTDYLDTHPPLPLRIGKFEQNAVQWWKKHKDEKRYIGTINLKNRISITQQAYANEWVKDTIPSLLSQ
jgi:predicted Zn-dependent protease